MSSKRLYVGNLPFSADDQALSDLFGTVGAVESARVVTDRESGRSKGFGFVEMATEADAQAAVQKLDGTDFNGRPIRVSEARPQEPRSGGGGGGGFGGGRGGRGGRDSGGRDRY